MAKKNTRNREIKIRVSDEELGYIRALSGDLPMATWLRELALSQRAKHERPVLNVSPADERARRRQARRAAQDKRLMFSLIPECAVFLDGDGLEWVKEGDCLLSDKGVLPMASAVDGIKAGRLWARDYDLNWGDD